jgi:endogenous inhibitor of DNA gyrase (YacG/DUF329 family)
MRCQGDLMTWAKEEKTIRGRQEGGKSEGLKKDTERHEGRRGRRKKE